MIETLRIQHVSVRTGLPFFIVLHSIRARGMRMRGVADNHPIYTQTVQLMRPGPVPESVCVCV